VLISHIILKDFGKFDEFECNFTPGLNLIKGPNESGKSTIADALASILFADPARSETQLVEVKKWGAVTSPSLEALFDIGGNHVKLMKDFEQGISNLMGDCPDIPEKGSGSIESWLSEKTGISSEEIFKATACVMQGGIAHIEESIEAIKDKLESLVTGGKEDKAGSDIIKKIDDRVVQLTLDMTNIGSMTDELDYNINKLKRDIDNMNSKRADLIQVETAFKNVYDDLAARKEKYRKAQEAARVAEKAAGLSKELEECEKKFTAAAEIKNKIKYLKETLSDLKKVTPEELREVEENVTTVNYYKHERTMIEKESVDTVEERDNYKIGVIGPGLAVLGLIGAAAFTAINLLKLFPEIQQNTWYFIVGSLAVILLGISNWNSSKQRHKFLSERAEKAKKKQAELESVMEESESQLSRLLSQYNASSPDEMKKNLWRCEEIKEKLAEEEKNYFSALGGQLIEELKDRRDKLESELESNVEENVELPERIMDKAELEREQLVIDQFDERIKDLDRERKILLLQIESGEGGSELLACYLERKAQNHRRIETMKSEVEVLGITKDSIDKARQNVLMSKLDVLNNSASGILGALTSGKYSQVRFDQSNLKFEVWADDKDNWVDPEIVLSSSTIDQIYLSARLALADLISNNKNSMYILDDPFAGYDDERLDNVMNFIKDLSKDHQVFLLASHNHYDKWADSTVNL